MSGSKTDITRLLKNNLLPDLSDSILLKIANIFEQVDL